MTEKIFILPASSFCAGGEEGNDACQVCHDLCNLCIFVFCGKTDRQTDRQTGVITVCYGESVSFADDTSILITDSNNIDFNINIHQSLTSLITWFNSNLLTLNLNKTHYIEFKTKNYYQVQTKVQYEHKDISNSTETKFLGLIIDETLSWNQHIDWIATKLCSACYVLRNLIHIVPQSTLRTIYYDYIDSILSYGIILGGNSTNVNKLFYKRKL